MGKCINIVKIELNNCWECKYCEDDGIEFIWCEYGNFELYNYKTINEDRDDENFLPIPSKCPYLKRKKKT
jgi:hypothetical protein